MRFRPQLKTAVWAVSMALATGSAMAGGWGAPTQGDSGQGVDTVIGNGLNPRGLDVTTAPDENGLGPFRAPVAHTPTGSPYSVPWQEPEAASMHASVEAGYLNTSGDNRAAKLIEYRDLSSGLLINNFSFDSENGNKHFNIFGGGVGRDDQYYGGSAGVYNDWRVTAFYNETPHVFTTTARPLWSGINTGYLSLVPALQFTGAAGGVDPATGNVGAVAGTGPANISDRIRAVVAATPDTTVELIRKKGGVRFDYAITDQWNFYANYTLEKRNGGRPFGQTGGGFPGPTATNSFGGFSNVNGQPVELVEPIDYNSQEFRTGVSFIDKVNALNLSFTASLFQDNIKQVQWENPYDSPTATYDRHLQQFTTPPDNEAYTLKLDYRRKLDFWNGTFNTTLSYGKQLQNDRLQPETTATGIFGPALEQNAAYWNSYYGPNGLPTLTRFNSDLHNDVSLASFGLTLNPTDKLTLNGKFRFNDFAQHNDYLACNPSLAAAYGTTCTPGNGSTAPIYGFLFEDGYGASTFGAPGTVAQNSSGAGIGGKVRSFDASFRQLNTSIGADYQVDKTLALNASYEREEVNRSERERDWTYEDKYKIGLVERDLFNGTLRTSLEYDHRTGSTWKMDAYMEANCANFYVNYASCQATYIDGTGTPASTSTPPANGKYDLADRNQLIFVGRYNYSFTDTLGGMITTRLKDETYPQAGALPVGRQERKDHSLSAELNYQPTTTTGGFVDLTYQSVDQSQWSIIPGAGASGCTEALYLVGGCNAVVGTPGSIYQNVTALDQFRYQTNERNWLATVGVNHTFGTVRFDADYTYTDTRSPMTYLYNDVTGAAGGSANYAFPDMTWVRQQLNLSATVPVSKQAAAHLLYKFDKADVSDWHYTGLSGYNNELGGRYYLDAGQAQPYRAQTIGVFLQYKM